MKRGEQATPDPIVLAMPEGMPLQAEEGFRAACAQAYQLTGRAFVCVPHGTVRMAERVEHSLEPAYDEAVIALPRIASALEDIARLLGDATKIGGALAPRR